MSISTYPEALNFWLGRINYEQRGMPADLSDLKLERMRTLLRRLGNPEQSLRIVHIAGSKGKGSSAAMLATVLQKAGYRTGLFTSPHLCRPEERVQVDGAPISSAELVPLMRELELAEPGVVAQEGLPPTFFEIITALAFVHFVRRRVEIAVVEVGLGGRFDSTNVCTPLLSVITSISLDHTQQLGKTPVAIAREKAGIIKPGRPTISGATDAEVQEVIAEIAARNGSPLRVLSRDISFEHEPAWMSPQESRLPRVRVRTRKRVWPVLELGLLGEHQAANAAVVVASIEELQTQGLKIADDAIRQGLAQVRWPARLELMQWRPAIVLDCAHNDASIKALVGTLEVSFPPAKRTLVFAASGDKDLAAMLNLLAPHFAQAYFTRYTSSLRGAAPEDLAGQWRQLGGGPAWTYRDPREALEAARAGAGPEEMICITGSVFLAGELRPHLEIAAREPAQSC